MFRLTTGAAALAVALTGCGDGSFFLEGSVQSVCHSETVSFSGLTGRHHLALQTTLEVGDRLPASDERTSISLALRRAELAATAPHSLPQVDHLLIELQPPADSSLPRALLAQADGLESQQKLSLTTESFDALRYLEAGQLQVKLTADVVIDEPVDATLQVCGDLTLRYQL